MSRYLARCVLLFAGGMLGAGVGPAAGAQQVIQFRDAGSGPGPQVLQQIIAGPHIVIPPGTTDAEVGRDSTIRTSVVVLGRSFVVEGTVQGDVIVVGGDLYTHPRSKISGRAIAIGGGVYDSALGDVRDGVQAYRDFTYDISPISGGWTLTYRQIITASEPFAFQFYGLRLPTYDRSDGLSLPIAQALLIPGTRLQIEPRVTYRSQLGRLDASATVVDSIGRHSALRAWAGRGTFSNESWIWSDLINSLEVLWRGHDTRNYYRATRGELTFSQQQESSTLSLERYAGGRVEEARSVRPDTNATASPWSLVSRNDIDDMRRPNPPIDPGTTRSVIVGTALEWTPSDIVARLRVDAEAGQFRRRCAECSTRLDSKFGQAAIDGTIQFPTFGPQTLRVDAHAVLTTSSGGTPRQRWAYIGGSGSIPTIDLLSRGGDELLYLDGRYAIPLERVTLPFFGHPIVTLREVIGGAAEGEFPTLDQATGLRLAAGYVYLEWLGDPARRRGQLSVGLTVAR